MSLRDLLEREQRSVARLAGASGWIVIAASVATLLALGTMVLGGARWLVLPRPVPLALWLGVLALLAAGGRWVRRRATRVAALPDVARQVEHERSLRDGSLRGALEVADSGALGRLGAEQLVHRLRQAREPVLAPALRRRMWRGVGVGATAALIGVAMLLAGTAMAPDGWAALLHPMKAWRGTLLEGVQLDAVPSSVLRGERLTVSVRAPGRRMVTVHHRRTGDSWRRTEVVVRDGRASLQLDPIDADLAIVASDGRATSDTAAVRMVDRPFIGGVTVRAQFPAYLDRQEETIPLGEPVRVPQGTHLAIEGESSTELLGVRLSLGRRQLPLDANGRHFSGRLTATASGRYEWSADGRSGPIGDVPAPLELEVLPDSTPQVEILAPAVDTTVSAGDTVAISVLATDDHGLATVGIRTWIVSAAGERRPVTTHARSAGGEAQWSGELALATGELRAGDALHVVAAATDRSPWRLTGESRELVLRLPTLSEQRDAVRSAADSAVARASAAAAAQKQLQQRTSEAARRRDPQAQEGGTGQRNDMSFEASEQAKSFAKEQRQLADRVEQLQEAARQLENQLRQAGALDSALQERLREAQKLLREALTPELAEQLRKLEQASQQLSQEDARKALADLAEQQRRMREQLEKSVEMLKRAALEGSMNTLTDEARELAKRERELADSIARARDERARSAAQQEARELAERTRDLTDDVKDLQQRLKQEKAEGGAERMAEAERRMQQAAQAMERAAKRDEDRPEQDSPPQGRPPGQRQEQQGQQRGQPQAGQPQAGQPQAGQPQGQQQGQQQQGQQGRPQPGQQGEQSGGEDAARQAAEAMEAAAEQLAQAREQQIGEWKQELTSELDRSIQEMIQLAREQDRLEQEARRGAPPASLRPQQSTLQQGVEKSAERLAQAGQRSSHVSQRSLRSVADARKRVEDATRQTQTAQTSTQAANAMREASEALNVAAASLVRDRERAESAQSASGFAEMLQQLQQMAQQQSALNSSVQDLLPRPGSSLDGRGQQESRQLARQQRDVAAQLDDVADRDDSGRADELAKEARQIAQILESAQLDPAVLERQQRLFRKMLDAGRLLEEDEREDTGKREAKAWTGTEVFTPQGTAGSGRAAARFQPPTWNDLRGLSPEERRLVLEYFKKINGDRP